MDIRTTISCPKPRKNSDQVTHWALTQCCQTTYLTQKLSTTPLHLRIQHSCFKYKPLHFFSAYRNIWHLQLLGSCARRGRARTAWQILLEALGCSHWRIWGAAKVTAGYRFHIFSLDCNLTKRRAWKWNTADTYRHWSCKTVAQCVSVNWQGVWFLALLTRYVVTFVPGTP